MDSSANAESHGAATCFHSAALAVSRSKFASHVLDYLPRSPTPARQRERQLGDRKRRCLCHLSPRPGAIIRIAALWLATEPMDMRDGPQASLTRVLAVFGSAKPNSLFFF